MKKIYMFIILLNLSLISCISTNVNKSNYNTGTYSTTPPKAETEIIFTYSGPQGANAKLYYKGQLIGIIEPGNIIRKVIPNNENDFSLKVQIGDEVKELRLTARGSITINVNITARRTPSGIVFTDFSIINRTPAIVRYVAADGLNVRNESNADAAWKDVIAQDTKVEILEEYVNGWVRIKYNNKIGYVNGKYLKITPPPLEITAMRVGNNDNNGRWLNSPGSNLYSSQMRYLCPVITYNATFSGQVTIFIKIIQPNGVIFRNPSRSPSGFSNSVTLQVYRGNNQTLQLTGWGNGESSSYQAGEWTVEIWYNNKRMWSEKITIRP